MEDRATLDGQIEMLKTRGVTFSLMDEERARSFLEYSSYYFKVKSYAHNYPRIQDGTSYRYEGLDFGHLVELSLIDFALSRLVWSLCSNIEHSMKIRFNRLIMDNPPEKASECATEFLRRKRVEHQEPDRHGNPYTDDLVSSCSGQFEIWHFWEMLSFSDQLELFRLYYRTLGKQLQDRHLLFIACKMRNAVSHGNCLLADMRRESPERKEHNRTDVEVTKAALAMCGKEPVFREGRGQKNELQRMLDRLVVHNYATVLICHLKLTHSPRLLEHACNEVRQFMDRVNMRRDTYFGSAGKREARNPLVDSTLRALIELSEGYLRKAEKRIENLDAEDPYGSRRITTLDQIQGKIDRRSRKIHALQNEVAQLRQQAKLLENPSREQGQP